jgi:3-oxoacyl-[acyl-carrier-protein] synthase II
VTPMRSWISGLGLVTPIGSDPASFWDALLTGTSGAAPITSFDSEHLPNHVGCEIHQPVLDEQTASALGAGRCTRLAAAAVLQALENAGIEVPLSDPRQTAIVVGTTMGEVTRFEQDRATHPDSEPGPEDVRSLVERPMDVMGLSIARLLGLEGPVLTAPAACAAGSYAIGLAASLVERGTVQRAIAVGCEAFSRLAFIGFTRMRAMSSDQCRPFSLNRPGLLLGEGAGALVIETEALARKRGASCAGFVDGFGLSCDAHHVTGPHPQGAGAVRAMQDAIFRAGLDRTDIDYINAHGTGTPLNDKTESLAIHTVFGEAGAKLPVSSIKALTGHMMGASGAVEAIASLLAIQHGVLPPTWNWTEADPDCAIDCVPNAPRQHSMRHVLSNSYAFGGNNACLALTAAEA